MKAGEKGLSFKDRFLRFRYILVLNLLALLPPMGWSRVILFFVLLAVDAAYILHLFGKLTGLNMFEAAGWCYRSRSSGPTGGKGPCLPVAIVAVISFVVAFTMLFTLFRVPSRVMEVAQDHAGGLLEYQAPHGRLHLYDPARRIHNEYYSSTTLDAASSFRDVFGVVVMYREPGRDYYQDTSFFSFSSSLALMIFGVLFLAGTFGLLFLMANEYAGVTGVGKPGFAQIMTRLRKIAGIRPWHALAIALTALLIIPLFAFFSIKRYTDLYGYHRDRLRGELMKRVSPGDTVTGSVILQFRGIEREVDTTFDEDTRRRKSSVRRHAVLYYTVRFSALIETPVYLNLKLYPGNEGVKALEEAFPKNDTFAAPYFIKDHKFTVNRDYSVSLKIPE